MRTIARHQNAQRLLLSWKSFMQRATAVEPVPEPPNGAEREAGVARASNALKLLPSDGRLRIAAEGKDQGPLGHLVDG